MTQEISSLMDGELVPEETDRAIRTCGASVSRRPPSDSRAGAVSPGQQPRLGIGSMRALASRSGRGWIPALALGVACAAQAAPGTDPLAWLQRAVQSARLTSYAGTYVHSNGDRTSTVRVTHVNANGEEHERIEPLDGPPYEIVRRNDEMLCYFPDAKTVRLDRRINSHYFPAIFNGTPESIVASYDVKLGQVERVLGYDCQWIRLDTKDGMRYAQRLCAEVGTGLIVRAKTLNESQQVMEQYTFTDLKLGPHVARSDVKSIFE